MDPLALAVRHRVARKRITGLARKAALREWRSVDAASIRGSYSVVQPRIAVILAAAQRNAAGEAGQYVSSSLQAQGYDSPAARINAHAFAGVASDGRDLLSLLESPLYHTMYALAHGASERQALAVGASVLDRIVATQTIDAGRIADGVGIAASVGVRGYVRIAAPPCCGRCAILGGQFYRWSAGFERHPYCDCYHVPVYGSSRVEQNPMDLFRNGQIRGMSKADIKAVNDGADLNQVINARRGMSLAAGRKVTTEGTTRRGFASSRLNGSVRLMPEQIYREAGGDRARAIALLRANGFIF